MRMQAMDFDFEPKSEQSDSWDDDEEQPLDADYDDLWRGGK